MFEDYTTYSGMDDLESDMDLIEIGVTMLEGDLDAGYGEFSGLGLGSLGAMNLATAKNYKRLLEKLKKAKAKAKGASGGKKKRADRRIKSLRRRLANIKRKKGRQIKRRKGRGKSLTKKQTKFQSARKSRKSQIRAFKQRKRIKKVRDLALKFGWPSDLTVTDKWLHSTKVKSPTYFIAQVYRTYIRAATVMKDRKPTPFGPAIRIGMSKIKKSDYRDPVSVGIRPYVPKLAAAARKYAYPEEKVEEVKTTEDGTPIRSMIRVLPQAAPSNVYRAQPALMARQRLMALRQQRAQMAAQQIAAQRAAQARQDALMQQQRAAMANQQRARAAALARQRAALAAQLAAQRAAYQRQMAQTASQERVIQSGAFQAFPQSSAIGDEAIEDTSLDMDMDMDEGEDLDEDLDEEGDEEVGDDDDFGDSDDDKPLYKNPFVLLGIAAAGFLGYKEMQKKKKAKGKNKPGAKPAA
tara:strand:- start:554 stop:1951 length:1398 start_codon:yes stop_codon:yes gene_type:complete